MQHKCKFHKDDKKSLLAASGRLTVWLKGLLQAVERVPRFAANYPPAMPSLVCIKPCLQQTCSKP